MIIPYLLTKLIHDPAGSIDADITHDESLLEFFVKLLIYGRKIAQNIIDALNNAIFSFSQSVLQPGKKAISH